MLSPSEVTYIASETISAGARVKFVAGSTARVELADAADIEIGTAILYHGKDSYAAEDGVGVALSNHPGTRVVLLGGTATAGDTLYRDVDGKVSTTGLGDAYCIAIDAGVAGNKIEAIRQGGGASAPAVDGLGSTRIARATFDPSGTAGLRTVGAHTLGVTLPANAIITRFFYDVSTAFTSGTSAATIAFSAEGANDLLSAVAINSGTTMFALGRHAGLPGFPNFGADAAHDTQVEVAALFAAATVKTTAARLITATVAVEALTAGKATLFVEYVIGA